jgi:hypothetical protein
MHPTNWGLSNNTKSVTRGVMIWEISMWQTKQTNYLSTNKQLIYENIKFSYTLGLIVPCIVVDCPYCTQEFICNMQKKLILSKFGNKNLIETKTTSVLLSPAFQSSHVKYIYEQCDEWIQWGQERIKWYILFMLD